TKLVQQFGSLEGLLENTAQLKGKQQENVRAFAEQGRLSKRLATILTDVPVELDHKALELEPPDKEKVQEVFGELEFRTLLKTVLEADAPPPAQTAPKAKVSPKQQPDLFSGTPGHAAAHEALPAMDDLST